MKGIYRFEIDCGNCTIPSVFVADSDDIAMMGGQYIFFGKLYGREHEVLVDGEIEELEFQLISDNPEEVEVFERLHLATGPNPFDYIDPNWKNSLSEKAPE